MERGHILASPDPQPGKPVFQTMACTLLCPALLLSGLFANSAAMALESDRKQPINIVADRITVDEKKGFSHYMGNVVMTQGSLRVTGDDIRVYLDDRRKLKRIIVVGKPATMQQKTDASQQLVKSRAERMEYLIASHTLHLKNNAHIEQGANRFSGNTIDYNMKTSLIQAHGSKKGDERVNITIVPEEDSKEPNAGNQDGTEP